MKTFFHLLLFTFFSTTSGLSIGHVSTAGDRRACTSFIQVKELPTLRFNNNGAARSLSFLTDSIFADYGVAIGFADARRMKESQSDHLEFTKYHNNSVDLSWRHQRVNRVLFQKEGDNYVLARAEISFEESPSRPALDVLQQKSKLSIGMTKREVAKMLDVAGKLCDTVNVSTDSEESWLLFRDNKLDKIIIDKYIH